MNFFLDGRHLPVDLETISDSLEIGSEHFNSAREFSSILEKRIEQISTQIHYQIHLHRTFKVTGLDWSKNFNQFKYSYLIDENRDRIFKNIIGINKISHLRNEISTKKDASFISFRINDQYYYVLEVEERKRHAEYIRILYNAMARILYAYQDYREKQELQKQISQIKEDLLQKEEALQIAQKAVKRRVYDLHNLVEASNEIYSILNFRQLINSALLTVIGQVGVQSAFMIMYDQSKRSYSQVYQKGFKAKEIQKLKFKVDSPIVKYFTKYNAPVYISALAEQKEFAGFVKKLEEFDIFILAPIVYSERIQGILATGEKLYSSEFTQTDFELFHVLVNIISISIENSLHYEAVKNLSLTDEMTKLHNYRSFVSRLKEEINRSRRNKSKVSLLILDIDHFKNYNDTLGHQAGDEALREVGKVLKKTVRNEDIVSRYGGEEFCIIFPGIEKDGILNLGERIRIKIEKHKFYKEKLQPGGNLTVSLGGATYPDDAKDMNGLIQKADEALYHAKHLGRNQIKIYS